MCKKGNEVTGISCSGEFYEWFTRKPIKWEHQSNYELGIVPVPSLQLCNSLGKCFPRPRFQAALLALDQFPHHSEEGERSTLKKKKSFVVGDGWVQGLATSTHSQPILKLGFRWDNSTCCHHPRPRKTRQEEAAFGKPLSGSPQPPDHPLKSEGR